MEAKVYEGKELETILESIKTELNITDNDFLYKKEEKKGTLLKKGSIKVSVYLLTDIANYAKEVLANITKGMGIETTFEVKIRENQILIKMYSDNNPLLIGAQGRTLQALNTIIRQVINNEISVYPNIYLDVENYKDKQQARIERLAKNIAREVIKTKIEVKMDNMNAYERRIVHNILSTYNKVQTISEGEEPNRHVVIKPVVKEDE